MHRADIQQAPTQLPLRTCASPSGMLNAAARSSRLTPGPSSPPTICPKAEMTPWAAASSWARVPLQPHPPPLPLPLLLLLWEPPGACGKVYGRRASGRAGGAQDAKRSR